MTENKTGNTIYRAMHLDPDPDARLRALAARQDRSLSATIRVLLRQALRD